MHASFRSSFPISPELRRVKDIHAVLQVTVVSDMKNKDFIGAVAFPLISVRNAILCFVWAVLCSFQSVPTKSKPRCETGIFGKFYANLLTQKALQINKKIMNT